MKESAMTKTKPAKSSPEKVANRSFSPRQPSYVPRLPPERRIVPPKKIKP